MHDILEEQYDMIIETLSSYHAYSAKIIKRFVLPVKEEKNLFKKEWFGKSLNRALSAFFKTFIINWHHMGSEMKQWIDQILSDEERSNPFSEIILSDYPIEALAKKIEHDLPNVSFVQIARLQKLKDEQLQPRWFNLKVLITGILAVGALLLRLFPSSLFKILEPDNLAPEIQKIGGFAGLYELMVFFYIALAIIFIVVMWSLYCSRIVKELRAKKRFIHYALEYFVLRAEMRAAQPNAAADVSFQGPSGPDPTGN